MKSLYHIIKLFLIATLIIGAIIFMIVLGSQIFHFVVGGTSVYYLVLLIPFAFVFIFNFIYKKLSYKNILLLSVFILLINAILGIVIINCFNTPLVAEPSYAHGYASLWVNGPYAMLHSLVWTHWGFYGLLLSKIFYFLGNSVFVMKMVGVCSIMVFNLFLVFMQKDLKDKNRPIFFALLLMSFYPAILLFLNFPTGDLVYIGFFGPVLYLFNKITDKDLPIKNFIYILSLASIILSIQNLFKDTTIVVVPILVAVLGLFFIKAKNMARFLLVPIIIIVSFLVAQTVSINILQTYNGGIANSSKIGYFIATGTSTESSGLFNGNYYYDKYWGPLKVAFDKGELDQETYKKVDKDMLDIAKVNIVDNFRSLPSLFKKKNYDMWSSDSLMIQQTSFNDPFFSGPKYTPMEPHRKIFTYVSDSFLILVTLFFIINCCYLLKTKKYTFINLFCTICVIGFFVAFTVMEGQPRYRIILMPLMIISAGYGIDIFIEWRKKHRHK